MVLCPCGSLTILGPQWEYSVCLCERTSMHATVCPYHAHLAQSNHFAHQQALAVILAQAQQGLQHLATLAHLALTCHHHALVA